MIGKQVERQGIIRAGAKMVMAVSEATVPRISVVVRKAYGAGLYAMSGPGFAPEATLAFPGAMIAVMGPEAAVNAVYYNRLQALPEPERAAEEARLRAEYREDVDIARLASELVVDAIVPPARLREEVAARLRAAGDRRDAPPAKRRSVTPM
jgi:acetyl-CoA carboxylase carboxyltransferase component